MDFLKALVTKAPFIITFFWATTVGVSMLKRKSWFKAPLFIFLVFSMVALLAGSAFVSGQYTLFRWLYFPASFMSLSMFPTYYLYIASLTSEKGLTRSRWLKHLIIPISHAALAGVVFIIIMDHEARIFWVERCLTGMVEPEGLFRFALNMDNYFRKLFLGMAIVYYMQTDKIIYKHRISLGQYFSNTETADIKWFPALRVAFFLTLLAAFFHFTTSRHATLEYEILPVLSYSLLSVFFWITGYFSQGQQRIYPPENTDDDVQEQVHATLSNEQYSTLARELEKIMAEQKIFTQRDLTLPGLSRILGTNRTYLSRLFNEHLHISFNHYINQKRVEYVSSLLDHEKQEKDIRDIWVMCGFNSASSFYRWFHTFKGTSPLAYRERVRKQQDQ